MMKPKTKKMLGQFGGLLFILEFILLIALIWFDWIFILKLVVSIAILIALLLLIDISDDAAKKRNVK